MFRYGSCSGVFVTESSLRKELREVSLPVMMRVALERKIILPDMRVTYSALYRLLQAEGLIDKPSSAPEDRRKFEAECPNDLWQSDVMHGPYVTVDGKQKKTYLIAFLDDNSRLIPHAEFYFHERLECFPDALRKALLMRWIPRKLYVDNGSAFRSHHVPLWGLCFCMPSRINPREKWNDSFAQRGSSF